MTIDPRSELGRKLEVETPVTIDLRNLSDLAGEQIASRLDTGTTRGEALVRLLNFAGKLMAEGVVSIDTNVIYSNHTEVQTAVEKIQQAADNNGKPITTGRTITKLLIVGSRSMLEPEPKNTPDKKGPWGDLFKDLGLDDFLDFSKNSKK